MRPERVRAQCSRGCPSSGGEGHGHEGLVAAAFDQEQHRLAAGLAGIGNGGLDVTGIVHRLVVDRDDYVTGLDAGSSG